MRVGLLKSNYIIEFNLVSFDLKVMRLGVFVIGLEMENTAREREKRRI